MSSKRVLRPEPQPRVVEAQLDVVGVLPDNELLTFTAAQRRLAALLLSGELGLGLRDEAGRLGLQLAPEVWSELRTAG